jgi:hypothetical protein
VTTGSLGFPVVKPKSNRYGVTRSGTVGDTPPS